MKKKWKISCMDYTIKVSSVKVTPQVFFFLWIFFSYKNALAEISIDAANEIALSINIYLKLIYSKSSINQFHIGLLWDYVFSPRNDVQSIIFVHDYDWDYCHINNKTHKMCWNNIFLAFHPRNWKISFLLAFLRHQPPLFALSLFCAFTYICVITIILFIVLKFFSRSHYVAATTISTMLFVKFALFLLIKKFLWDFHYYYKIYLIKTLFD